MPEADLAIVCVSVVTAYTKLKKKCIYGNSFVCFFVFSLVYLCVCVLCFFVLFFLCIFVCVCVLCVFCFVFVFLSIFVWMC